MTSPSAHVSVNQISSKGRLALGGTILVVGQLSPLSAPLVEVTVLPAGWKADLSGPLLLGIPEFLILVAVVILEKSRFNFINTQIFWFFKRHAPPDLVSPLRY